MDKLFKHNHEISGYECVSALNNNALLLVRALFMNGICHSLASAYTDITEAVRL